MPSLITLLFSALILRIPSNAGAEQHIGRYQTLLSETDYFSSASAGLGSAAAILRRGPNRSTYLVVEV